MRQFWLRALCVSLPAMVFCAVAPAQVTTLPASTHPSGDGTDLTSLTLEDLMNVEVTSVAKERRRSLMPRRQ